MKVVHLISGGDTGGAKTHILSLLSNIAARVEIQMVCFMEGPFAQEARETGIPTTVMEGKNILATLKRLENFIRDGEFQIIHCHGARANMMGALLRSVKYPSQQSASSPNPPLIFISGVKSCQCDMTNCKAPPMTRIAAMDDRL